MPFTDKIGEFNRVGGNILSSEGLTTKTIFLLFLTVLPNSISKNFITNRKWQKCELNAKKIKNLGILIFTLPLFSISTNCIHVQDSSRNHTFLKHVKHFVGCSYRF